MNNKLEISPISTEWLSEDDIDVSDYMIGLGFQHLSELMPMRVFDLLNLDRIDAIRAEEIVVCLYKYLHPENERRDKDIYLREIEQDFNFKAFLKGFASVGDVTVGDLVDAEDMNREALYTLIDSIKSAFWRSPEYDWHCYKFRNKLEYLTELNRRKKAFV